MSTKQSTLECTKISVCWSLYLGFRQNLEQVFDDCGGVLLTCASMLEDEREASKFCHRNRPGVPRFQMKVRHDLKERGNGIRRKGHDEVHQGNLEIVVRVT